MEFGSCARSFLKGMAHMIRFVIAVGVGVMLLGDSALADDRCDQVRQAVATYGYAAARKHALENYGEAAVAFGDNCLRGSGVQVSLEAAEPKLETGRATTAGPKAAKFAAHKKKPKKSHSDTVHGNPG
jgi:hypothetical protein